MTGGLLHAFVTLFDFLQRKVSYIFAVEARYPHIGMRVWIHGDVTKRDASIVKNVGASNTKHEFSGVFPCFSHVFNKPFCFRFFYTLYVPPVVFLRTSLVA